MDYRKLPSLESQVIDEIRRPTMSDSMYKNLEGLNLKSAWDAIITEVIPLVILSDHFITPYVDEARDFNLFSVFVKRQRCCCKNLMKCGRKYRFASRLQNEVKHIESDVFAYTTDEVYGIPKDFVFESVGRSGVNGAVDKSLMFIMKGSHKLTGMLHHLKKNDMIVSMMHPEFKKNKHIYVVNEIIMAKSVTVQMSIGDKKKRWEFIGPIPLAFKMIKLRLKSTGNIHLDDPIDVLPRTNDKEPVEWERPSISRSKYL